MVGGGALVVGAFAGWYGASAGFSAEVLAIVGACGLFVAAAAIALWLNLRRREPRLFVVRRHNREVLANLPAVAEWRDLQGRTVRFTAGGLLEGDFAFAVDRGGYDSLRGFIYSAETSDPAVAPYRGSTAGTVTRWLVLALFHEPNAVEWEQTSWDADTGPSFTGKKVPEKRKVVVLPLGEEGLRVARDLLLDSRITARTTIL